jgi:uncharacterized protein YceH (UPF0502 family)
LAATVVVVGVVATVVVCGWTGLLAVELEDDEAPQPAASDAIATAAVVSVRRLVDLISQNKDARRANSFPPSRVNGPQRLSSGAVHFSELTPPEQRVLGCLIEKRWTTPDQYPLSLNALRLACNQSTNRDPVTDYDEATIRDAAQRLSRYGLARLASGHSSRAVKYRHLAEEALALGRDELAALAVLVLRGPQTPGELKARTERMTRFDSLADVERALDVLSERGYVRRVPRRPGQKEDRFAQLLGGEVAEIAPAPHAEPSPESSPPPRDPADDDIVARIVALEADIAELRREVSALRAGGPTGG